MAKSSLPPFKLFEVSETRKRFLLQWQLERKLDLELRETSQTEERVLVAEGGVTRYSRASRSFDRTVCAGDIRLLPAHDTPDENRFLYVTVLYVREGFSSVIVPFSSYSAPACKDEWLTGISSEPLKVLQFWNAQPVATKDLAQSWKTGELGVARLKQARLLYRHAIDGTWPQGDLREQVGLAILNPTDERLAYQSEELAQLAPLRGRLFNLMEQAERFANCSVRFESSGSFEFGGTHRMEAQERLAADDGGVVADVVVLTADGKVVKARATREADAANRILRWRISDAASAALLLPGLPACLYSKKARKPLVAQGATIGDGTDVLFKVASNAAFARLLTDDGLWISIGGMK